MLNIYILHKTLLHIRIKKIRKLHVVHQLSPVTPSPLKMIHIYSEFVEVRLLLDDSLKEQSMTHPA